MIFIEHPPEESILYNKRELSLLAAKEGVEVNEMLKKGIYLNDNYEIINQLPIYNFKKIKQKHEQTIQYLLSNLKIERHYLIVVLNKFNKKLPKKKIKGKKYYQFTKEECDIFIHLYKTKQTFLLLYVDLLEAKDFLNHYFPSKEFRLAYLKTSIKLKLLKEFKHIRLSNKNYFLQSDKESILKFIKEV